MTSTSLLAFVGLCALLALTPGPDTFLTLQNSLKRASTGMMTALGCSLSSLAWAVLAGVGLAAVVEQSAEAYRWIKIVGAAYLIYLGVSSFLKSRKAARLAMAGDDAEPAKALKGAGSFTSSGARSGLVSGMLSTILNPKVGLFYLAIVPQFMPHGDNALGMALLLGLINAAVGWAYLAIVALAAAKMVRLLKRPRVTQILDRVSSGILAALGIGVGASAISS